ncbi:RANB3 protein, partial [Polypterus senegalus]
MEMTKTGYCVANVKPHPIVKAAVRFSKNNVFMPSNFCQSPTGNSDSEPEEKTIGFRLKPPTLIHGQAPSADSTSGTNGVNKTSSSESNCESQNNTEVSDSTTSEEKENEKKDGLDDTEEKEENKDVQTESAFVFGQNLKERVKVEESDPSCTKGSSSPVPETQSGSTNYFLQYISTPSSQNAANNTEATGSKFVFGQNMYMRVLASSKDTGQLYAALHHRILALRSRAEQEQETKSVAAEPEVTQSNEEDSDEDDVLTPGGSTVASGKCQ